MHKTIAKEKMLHSQKLSITKNIQMFETNGREKCCTVHWCLQGDLTYETRTSLYMLRRKFNFWSILVVGHCTNKDINCYHKIFLRIHF